MGNCSLHISFKARESTGTQTDNAAANNNNNNHHNNNNNSNSVKFATKPADTVFVDQRGFLRSKHFASPAPSSNCSDVFEPSVANSTPLASAYSHSALNYCGGGREEAVHRSPRTNVAPPPGLWNSPACFSSIFPIGNPPHAESDNNVAVNVNRSNSNSVHCNNSQILYSGDEERHYNSSPSSSGLSNLLPNRRHRWGRANYQNTSNKSLFRSFDSRHMTVDSRYSGPTAGVGGPGVGSTSVDRGGKQHPTNLLRRAMQQRRLLANTRSVDLSVEGNLLPTKVPVDSSSSSSSTADCLSRISCKVKQWKSSSGVNNGHEVRYTFYMNDDTITRRPLDDKRLQSIAAGCGCRLTFHERNPSGKEPHVFYRGAIVIPITIVAMDFASLLRCLNTIHNRYPRLNVKAFLPI